jgi:hypothetical protein
MATKQIIWTTQSVDDVIEQIQNGRGFFPSLGIRVKGRI